MSTQGVVNRPIVHPEAGKAVAQTSILIDQKWKKPVIIQEPKPDVEIVREHYEYFFTSHQGEEIQVTHEEWLCHETGDTYRLVPKKNTEHTMLYSVLTWGLIVFILATIALLFFSIFI